MLAIYNLYRLTASILKDAEISVNGRELREYKAALERLLQGFFNGENGLHLKSKFIEEVTRNCWTNGSVMWERMANVTRDFKKTVKLPTVSQNRYMQIGEYKKLNTNRSKYLAFRFGSAETASLYMLYDAMCSGGQTWAFKPYALFRRYFSKTRGKINFVEGFASPINSITYEAPYDIQGKFCSLFPQLERRFGSIGTFFDTPLSISKNWYINPPFIESLLKRAALKVREYIIIRGHSGRILFIGPNWQDAEYYKILSGCCISHKEYTFSALGAFSFHDNRVLRLKRIASVFIL